MQRPSSESLQSVGPLQFDALQTPPALLTLHLAQVDLHLLAVGLDLELAAIHGDWPRQGLGKGRPTVALAVDRTNCEAQGLEIHLTASETAV